VTAARLIFRGLRYHWRTESCIAFGLAVATAVITGSLLVGDSMTATLRHNALQRLGRIEQVLIAPYFFREGLAQEISTDSSAVLISHGSARRADAEWAMPNVSIIGVDEYFWKLFPNGNTTNTPDLHDDSIAVNRALADELHIKTGDDIVLNFDRLSAMDDDNLFSQRKNRTTLPVTVATIVPDDGGGTFATDARAAAPRNVFMARSKLATLMQHPHMANAILAAAPVSSDALAQHVQLADYGLSLVPSTEGGYVAIESASLLLSTRQMEAAQQAATDLHATAAPTSVYLATRITGRSHSISYAMVAATDANGIILNNWATDDLSATVGDELELTYLLPTSGGEYSPATIKLTLNKIVDLSGANADRHLTPDLNGLTDARKIDHWNMPFPLTEKITDRDDQYWDRFGPTPKAFVDPQTMRRIWASALPAGVTGWVTSMRIIPPADMSLANLQAKLGAAMLRHLSPQDGQMAFRPLRQQMLQAAEGSTDFGQLFLYLSFFLIIAAAALSAMLLRLQVQQRSAEMGMMLASGFRSRQISWISLAESSAVSVVGTLAGLPFGVIYTVCIIAAMNHWWMQPWDNAGLVMAMNTSSLLIGGGSGLALGLLCSIWAMRGLRKQPILRLLSGRQAVAMPTTSRYRSIMALAPLSLSLILLILAAFHRISPEAGFFGGGAAMLLASIAALWAFMSRPLHGGHAMTFARLAWRNACANRVRSVTTMGILAAASFILVAVAANRRDLSHLDVRDPAGGAGGFALRATTSLPLRFDLNSPSGRAKLGFSSAQEKSFVNVTTIALPMSAGDDVSCLNLSQPMQARLLGVTPQLIQRNAFTVELADSVKLDNPWKALQSANDSDAIPAFGDADSIQWILHSGLGETYTFIGPAGMMVKLKIAGVIHGSIFGSELLVNQANLRRIYPQLSGSTCFLLAVPPGKENQLATVLRAVLADEGIDVQSTQQILNRFISVQNVYLSIFMTLGGLGLLLGTAGMIAVIFRSAFERRGELALMSAAGFARDRLVRLLLLENAGLLLTGIFAGTIAALLAIAPALASAQVRPNWLALALLLPAVAASGLVCCMLASHWSIAATPAAALREE